jgi:hypothetical protein
MDETAQVHLATLEDEVRAAVLSEAGKHSALWCLGRLLPQYALYRQTCESRYGEEITRLVRGLLKVITEDPGGGPSVQPVATRILDRLQILHEQLGLPGLGLPAPKLSPRRSRTPG